MTMAPIALFVYNRPIHTRRTVEALKLNSLASKSDLFVFSDGPAKSSAVAAVDETRAYTRTISGFRSVTLTERTENIGLANSIIEGVTHLCSLYDRVIVVEDDLITSPWFLEYMNSALALYEREDQVASIHGYCFPVKEALPETFFLRGADCWGWATWNRAWRTFETDGQKLLQLLQARNLEHEFDIGGANGFTKMLRAQVAGRIDSWAIRWHASCFLSNMLTLYPGRSLVHNIGHDGSGVHSDITEEFATPLSNRRIEVSPITIVQSDYALEVFAKFYRQQRKVNLLSRLARVFRRWAS